MNKYPEGKISEDDEGALTIVVRVWRNNVRIDFAEPTAWLSLPAAQARSLGMVLIKRAEQLEAYAMTESEKVMEEPKPCHNCAPYIEKCEDFLSDGIDWRIHCVHCDNSVVAETIEEAIAAWNRRTP
jgi:hypothetical protein